MATVIDESYESWKSDRIVNTLLVSQTKFSKMSEQQPTNLEKQKLTITVQNIYINS